MGGGVAGRKVLGVYGRDVLNVNGKLLLGFAEDNELALLTTLFRTPKLGVSYTFVSANLSKGQTRLDYILTKKVDHRLIRFVKVRRPPLEAPESDENLAYASPLPMQAHTKPEVGSQYEGSEDGRPQAVDG